MGSKVRGAGSSCGSGFGRVTTTALARIAAATVRVGNTYQARSGLRLCAERDGGMKQNRGYGHQPIIVTLGVQEVSLLDLYFYPCER